MQASNTNQQDQTVPVVTPSTPRRRHVGRWLSLFAVVLIVGAASALMLLRDNLSNVQAATAATVEITSRGLDPQTIKVKKGEGVTWVNKGAQPRQIVADPYPSGDSLKSLNSVEPLTEGDSYTAIFEQAGTFTYHDQLDPTSFKGTVIVE